MSMPTLISLNTPTAATATGSNALKALHPAGSEATGEGSPASVHFTLDEADSSSAAADMSTQLNGVAKGTPSASGPTTNPKSKSSAAASPAGGDTSLLSMLQAISVLPTVAVVATPATSSTVAATGSETGKAGSASEAALTSLASAASGTASSALAAATNLSASAAAISVTSMAGGDTAAALPVTGDSGKQTATAATTSIAGAQPAASTSVSISTLQSLQQVVASTPQISTADAVIASAKTARPERQQAAQSVRPSNAAPGSNPSTAQASAINAAVTPAAITDLVDAVADTVVTESQSQFTSRARGTNATATPVASTQGSVARPSSLLAVLTQTITDVAAAAADATANAAPPMQSMQSMQSMSTAFSSLMQQIVGEGGHGDASSTTFAQGPTVADMQLAAAVSPATASTLPTTAAPDLGTSANANVVSPSTAAPIDTTRQDWPDALGSRVDWMLHQGLQEARIELHPRDMGSINVHIKLGNDGADVRFAATNPNVRDALESSLPKLRELLAGSGLQLAQAQVGSQMQQQESAGQFQSPQTPARSPSPASGNTVPTDQQAQPGTPRVRVAQISIIDAYA